jgi:hypothetical protein
MKTRPILIVKPLRSASAEQVAVLQEQLAGLSRRLEKATQPTMLIQDVAVYWLRPGDSTVEMDARAEKLRAEAKALERATAETAA